MRCAQRLMFAAFLFVLASLSLRAQDLDFYDEMSGVQVASTTVTLVDNGSVQSVLEMVVRQPGQGWSQNRQTMVRLIWYYTRWNMVEDFDRLGYSAYPSYKFDTGQSMIVLAYDGDSPTSDKNNIRAKFPVQKISRRRNSEPGWEEASYWSGYNYILDEPVTYGSEEIVWYTGQTLDWWERIIAKDHIKIRAAQFEGHLPRFAHNKFYKTLKSIWEKMHSQR